MEQGEGSGPNPSHEISSKLGREAFMGPCDLTQKLMVPDDVFSRKARWSSLLNQFIIIIRNSIMKLHVNCNYLKRQWDCRNGMRFHMNHKKVSSARLGYCGLFGLSLIVSWVLREVGTPLLKQISSETRKDCKRKKKSTK